MGRGSARQPGRNARPVIDLFDAAFSAAVLVAAATASGHAVVYKRDPRSEALWLVVSWMLPAAGSVLYVLFGCPLPVKLRDGAARLFAPYL